MNPDLKPEPLAPVGAEFEEQPQDIPTPDARDVVIDVVSRVLDKGRRL